VTREAKVLGDGDVAAEIIISTARLVGAAWEPVDSPALKSTIH
jgi:hypothetical protein